MTHPLESLIFACLAIALALALFWPQQGFYWQIRRGNRNTERVVIEDALKHFYDREERGSAGTLASLAGSKTVLGVLASLLEAKNARR